MWTPERANFCRELAGQIAGQGAVMTEFPFGRQPDRTTFPIRNRIVMPAMGLAYTNDYSLTGRHRAFYLERARGGVGLMIVGPASIDTADDVDAIEQAVHQLLEPVVTSAEQRVAAVVNYDNFSVPLDLSDDYARMVRDVVNRFYSSVSRYSTSAFMRMMLGIKFSRHGLSPEIHVGEAEALESAKRARAATGDKS
jgi:hypothetical protein